jgi:hypothetical protein
MRVEWPNGFQTHYASLCCYFTDSDFALSYIDILRSTSKCTLTNTLNDSTKYCCYPAAVVDSSFNRQSKNYVKSKLFQGMMRIKLKLPMFWSIKDAFYDMSDDKNVSAINFIDTRLNHSNIPSLGLKRALVDIDCYTHKSSFGIDSRCLRIWFY